MHAYIYIYIYIPAEGRRGVEVEEGGESLVGGDEGREKG